MVIRVEKVVQKNSSLLAERLKPKNAYQKAREVVLSYISDGKPLTKEQEQAVGMIMNQRYNHICWEICRRFSFDNRPILETQKELLDKFVQIMKDKNIDFRVLKKIKDIKTIGELNSYIMRFPSEIAKYEICPVYKEAVQHKKWGFPLEYEQLMHKKVKFAEECIATLFKMFAKPSENPEVIKIENILKEQYGVETALLNDDNIAASKILKSVKILKANNIPIPKEYIVSDFAIGGRALRTDKHTVLLSSTNTKMKFESERNYIIYNKKEEQVLLDDWKKQCGFKNHNSSDANEHAETHEACHFLHLPFLAFGQKKENKQFIDTVKKLSGYAATKSKSHYEIYAELKAKSLYEPLDSKEQHLLNILEGTH